MMEGCLSYLYVEGTNLELSGEVLSLWGLGESVLAIELLQNKKLMWLEHNSGLPVYVASLLLATCRNKTVTISAYTH